MRCLKPGGEPCSMPCSDLDGANPTLQAVPVLPGTTASHQPHPRGAGQGSLPWGPQVWQRQLQHRGPLVCSR